MTNGKPHDFGRGFAQLTGLREDAATPACDGQKANLENFRSHNLVVSIGAHLKKSDNLLAEIRTQLNS